MKSRRRREKGTIVKSKLSMALAAALILAATAAGTSAKADTIYSYIGHSSPNFPGNYLTATAELTCSPCTAGTYLFGSGIASFDLTINVGGNPLYTVTSAYTQSS